MAVTTHRWFFQAVKPVIYINGTGVISPQKTYETPPVLTASSPVENILWCQEPDYKTLISPRASRRMSRVIKMGVASSFLALNEAALDRPDAIVVGTGYGCMIDTERFLTSIIENEEKFLNPAPFIHSTHNTISSQIALLKKCTGYNQTYVHGSLSFESALLDGMMLLEEGGAQTVLVGGVDEMTENLFSITRRFQKWKDHPFNQGFELFDSNSAGTIAGEGSSFFLLSNRQNAQTYAGITDVSAYRSSQKQYKETQILDQFLEKAQLKPDDIDLYLIGKSGDNRLDKTYDDFIKNNQGIGSCGYYKHLCGEYHTASAFAVWLGAYILKNQTIPEEILVNNDNQHPLQHIVIYSQNHDKYHSLILLSATR